MAVAGKHEVHVVCFENRHHIFAHLNELEPRVYGIPDEIDRDIARLKLESMGIRIDPMTPEQKAYSESWESGT